MHHYKTILVAIDFSHNSEQALQRAKQVAQVYSADLQVIHVTEVPTYPVLEDVAITGIAGVWDDQLGEKLYQASLKRLTQMADAQNIDHQACHVITGIPRIEITARAQQIGADLIVIGRRGLSGLQRLIGSTADAVIHDASCDVLAVNLKE